MATSADDTKLRGGRHPSTLGKNPRAAAIARSPDDRSGRATSTKISRDIWVAQHTTLPHLYLEDLSPTIGTVVHGIDIASVSDQEVEALYALLLTRKVIFLRDQHCSETEHIEFARRFGTLEIHPFNPMHPSTRKSSQSIQDQSTLARLTPGTATSCGVWIQAWAASWALAPCRTVRAVTRFSVIWTQLTKVYPRPCA